MSSKKLNDFRFAELMELIKWPKIDYQKNIIVSTIHPKKSLYDQQNFDQERFYEIKNLAELMGWSWIEIDSDNTELDYFLQAVQNKLRVRLHADNFKIIFAGTCTTGCVLYNHHTSLLPVFSQGYNCAIYLPLCADPHQGGVYDFEKGMRGFVELYQAFTEYNMHGKVPVCHRIKELGLTLKA